MLSFGAFIAERGFELRFERFALFQNIYRPGASEHLDLVEGRKLFDAFFRTGCGEIEPAPGAVEALATPRNPGRSILGILSNAPADAERLRLEWLKRHGLPHALVLSSGPKGPITAGLVAQTCGKSAFVDDLIPNLDSVADHSPQTATFQHVAAICGYALWRRARSVTRASTIGRSWVRRSQPRSAERPLQIGDQIVDAFDADRKSDQRIGNSQLIARSRRDRGVG